MKGFENECNSHGIMLAGESQGKIFLKITVLKKKKKETEWRRQGGRFLKGIERKERHMYIERDQENYVEKQTQLETEIQAQKTNE